MKLRVAILAVLLSAMTVGGCVGPRPCPPGTHPGPYGRRCFLNYWADIFPTAVRPGDLVLARERGLKRSLSPG